MNFNKIASDVIADFRRNEPAVHFNDDLTMQAFKQIIEPITVDLNAETVYALCMESLYYTYYPPLFMKDVEEVSYAFIIKSLKELFTEPLNSHIQVIEEYKWLPKQLEDVLEWGYTIFEKAKDAYSVAPSGEDVDIAIDLYSKMVQAREQFNSLDYVYRTKNDIMQMYERELAESQLDLNVVKGDKSVLSQRLSERVDSPFK